MACKTLTCCDLDDFPQTSSSNTNCPMGNYWNENLTACVRIPSNALLNEDGTPILNEDGEPILL